VALHEGLVARGSWLVIVGMRQTEEMAPMTLGL
jgi:hypothetical protein